MIEQQPSPKLVRVIRLDSVPPLSKATYTEEGYLKDTPILTSTGIFEYKNKDGSIRRELRLPEEVFDPDSLKSYRGKPIIITHDAGAITKDNVQRESIGTILSDGYQDGSDVRAEIIIHNTDRMKQSGLKELSCGYHLDLEETPGVWEGQHYDAIQRNIRINHLALVFEARAGEQARLNIDGRDRQKKKGATNMAVKQQKNPATRTDGVLSSDELKKAIEEYKARRAKISDAVKPAEASDADEPPAESEAEENASKDETAEKLQMVKDRRDRRDEEGDPKDKKAAMGVIAQQDDDMETLFDIIDTLLAERDFNDATQKDCAKKDSVGDPPDAPADGAESEEKTDDDDPETEEASKNADSMTDDVPSTDKGEAAKMNADSVDAIVRQRVQLGMIGQTLNMDGLENMKLADAKKAVIGAVLPGMRLDGKSDAYIEAMYDCAVRSVKTSARRDTAYQKRQMFNADSAASAKDDGTSAASRRQAMINRQFNQNKEEK